MNNDLIDKLLYDCEDRNEVLKEIDNITDEETLYSYVSQYNWDDGFIIPSKIIDHKCMSLSIALMLFYDAEGNLLFTDEIDHSTPQYEFVSKLYNRILNGTYKVGLTKYEIPLTKIEIFKYLKQGVNSIFLTNI